MLADDILEHLLSCIEGGPPVELQAQSRADVSALTPI
jgi:hypothetical protein